MVILTEMRICAEFPLKLPLGRIERRKRELARALKESGHECSPRHLVHSFPPAIALA